MTDGHKSFRDAGGGFDRHDAVIDSESIFSDHGLVKVRGTEIHLFAALVAGRALIHLQRVGERQCSSLTF